LRIHIRSALRKLSHQQWCPSLCFGCQRKTSAGCLFYNSQSIYARVIESLSVSCLDTYLSRVGLSHSELVWCLYAVRTTSWLVKTDRVSGEVA